LELLRRKNYRFRALQPALPDGYHKIGSWVVDEIGADPVTLTLPVPTHLQTKSSFSVSVHYSGGAYGVWIDTVEVRRSEGTERLEQVGSTGNFDEGNEFPFEAGSPPIEVSVKLRSKGTGNLERNNAGDVYLVFNALGNPSESVAERVDQ
jgi:hypothetical protein